MTKEYITIEELESAYLDCRKNKRRKTSSLLYELDYELNNLQLYRDLNDMAYEIGESICFCVTRPKLREVFAADFRDRIVHHLIMNKFLPIFESEMIDDSYNCRVGKGTMYGVQRIKQHIEYVSDDYKEDAWVLKCDLQGFFMSIDKDILWSLVESIIRNKYNGDDIEWWLWLIKKVIYHRPELKCRKQGDLRLFDMLPDNKTLFKSNGKGLPIGNLTSQIFANVYLSRLDNFILDNIEPDDRYGRYVDDFVIIRRNKGRLLHTIPFIREFLTDKLHVTLHSRKFYLQHVSKGVEFVGSVIKPHRTYTGNRTVYNFANMVKEWNADPYPDTERYVARYNSYSGFLVHNNTYAIRRCIYNSIEPKEGICMVGHMEHLKIINKHEIRKKSNQQRPLQTGGGNKRVGLYRACKRQGV